MALSITECRKNRGNAKGSITRAGNQVSYFLKSDITTLDPAALARISESIDRADDSFQTHHDMLYHDHGNLADDDYFHESDEHHAQVADIRRNINTLSARLTATQALRKIEASMALLEIAAKDGFVPQLLDNLPRAKTLYLSFEDSSTHITLSDEAIFIKARESLSTRLDAISTLCRPHQPGLPGAVLPAERASFPHPHAIKVSMPKFDGKMLHWKSFWSLFDAIMKKNPHLTPESQRVLLLEAMDSPEATELAREALSYNSTYEGAAARLRKNYEDDTELHTHHVTRLLQTESFKNTRTDLKRLLHRIEKHTEGIRASNGYTLD